MNAGTDGRVGKKQEWKQLLACVSLLAARVFGIENVLLSGSVQIFIANNIILTRLKTLELQLWILFIGATIENAHVRSNQESERRHSRSDDPDHPYRYVERLEFILQDTHLNWRDCQPGLNSFLLLDHLNDLLRFKPECS